MPVRGFRQLPGTWSRREPRGEQRRGGTSVPGGTLVRPRVRCRRPWWVHGDQPINRVIDQVGLLVTGPYVAGNRPQPAPWLPAQPWTVASGPGTLCQREVPSRSVAIDHRRRRR